jgi:aspartate carbamoyltransferase catalytic subunit
MDDRYSLRFRGPHLLGIEGLAPYEIQDLLDRAEACVDVNRGLVDQRHRLAGRTLLNLFFENSTRTRTSFELAGKRWAPTWSTWRSPPPR